MTDAASARAPAATALSSAGMPDALDAWLTRLRAWQPSGPEDIPVAELVAFLRSANLRHGRASKSEVLKGFPQWAAFARALADNPLVMVHAEAAELIVGGVLTVLRKLGTAGVQDEALRAKLDEASWWCSCFLRDLVGKPAPRSAVAAASARGALPMLAQRGATSAPCSSTRLRQPPRRWQRAGGGRAGGGRAGGSRASVGATGRGRRAGFHPAWALLSHSSSPPHLFLHRRCSPSRSAAAVARLVPASASARSLAAALSPLSPALADVAASSAAAGQLDPRTAGSRLPLSAAAVGGLLACAPSLTIAQSVERALLRLHACEALRALASCALLGPPMPGAGLWQHLQSPHAAKPPDAAGTSSSGSASGPAAALSSLETASQRAWRALLARLPDILRWRTPLWPRRLSGERSRRRCGRLLCRLNLGVAPGPPPMRTASMESMASVASMARMARVARTLCAPTARPMTL